MKDSGNSPISPKSIRTIFPCSSTPKLLRCMSNCVNIKRSPHTLTGDHRHRACRKSIVYAWPRLHVDKRWILER
ncbi:hypothetical protein PISMIDRAFT_646187 [Pisolithus microcarpus 441]|uniref:Uncharacterized protein n=1 Tax=Pisolithus microcarpus 441 TaxID=765257 RepID=A0A0C9YHD6_9AGAM|nr:hypothetical protein PISMIDRAFT_646187 [Pisolithus microcarpus 441]